MSALVCLRILLHPVRLEKPGGAGLLLASKIAATFFEAQWAYPRRAAAVSPTSYLLSDPRAAAISPESLQALAAELQRQFFGAADSGEASLIVFIGAQEELSRCSMFPAAELRMLIEGQLGPIKSLLKAGIWKITSRAITELQAPQAQTSAPDPDPNMDETRACFRGIFLSAKQEFIGNVGSRWRSSDQRHTSILDGPSHFPSNDNAARFDEESAQACAAAIAEDKGSLSGLLYLPVCYTNLVKRGERETYARFLKVLETLPQTQLTATLYDVPRDPFYGAMGEVTNFLNERFGAVDLLIADPGFNMSSLSQSKVRSMSLCLPNSEDALRLSALKRFAENRDEFRRKQILPMLSNVRSAAEIAASQTLKIPLISGKAVTDIMTRPLAMFPYMTDALPLTNPAAL